MKGTLDGGKVRPHLLVLASTYPRWVGDHEPGFVHELAKRLVHDFHVTVLCPHAPGALPKESLEGVEVIRFRYAPTRWETLVNDGGIVTNLRRDRWKLLLVPGFVLAQIWAAWRLLRRRCVDVIHAHWLVPQGLIAAVLQSLSGRNVPYVVTSHGADLYALKGPMMDALRRFVLHRAASATVVSEAMRDALAQAGADVSCVSAQPMGVDLTDHFTPDPATPRSGDEILFVGRLVEKKGLRYLIEAMPQVRARLPDAFLTVAGFGPCESSIRAQVREAGLEHAVRFLGPCSQEMLPSLYRRAGVFVAPFVRAVSGDEEGFGLVVAEALGCGCPVVVGDVPAVYDLLRAWPRTVVDPRDVDSLAGSIIHALENKQEALDIANQLRQALLIRLDWPRVAEGYAKELTHVLDNNSLFRNPRDP